MSERDSSIQPDHPNLRNPACDVCREKKVRSKVGSLERAVAGLSFEWSYNLVRCGREKPVCENCKIWKTGCAYSDRLKRDNDQSRQTQRFEEVHDRLDRIENAMQRLASALERVVLQHSQTPSDGSKSMDSPEPVFAGGLSQVVDRTLSSSTRSSQTQGGTLLADKRGDLQYLGANSLPSITFEAESIAQQKLRLKLPTLSGRSRTEASNVLRRLNGVKSSASSFFPEDGELSSGRPNWWFPERAEAMRICVAFFDHSNALYPVFRRASFLKRVNDMYDHPEKTPELEWLACFNNTLLFGLYTSIRPPPGLSLALMKRLIDNNWLAFKDISLFLTPRLLNIQALLTAVVVAQETSRPGLCWALLCQACRLAQAIGLHRRSDPAQFRDPGEYEERKWVFWNLYVLDKTLSMAFGRTVFLPDFDIDVELPSDSEEINWQMVIAWTSLAKIQSRTYERLYSASSLTVGPEQRHAVALGLSKDLQNWVEGTSSFSYDDPIPSISAYLKLELRFNFYNSLLMIHRVNHGGGKESEDICLDAARKAIVAIRTALSEHAELAESRLVLWLYLYYPFTPFFTLFTHIVRHPQLPTTREDLDLIRYVRDHLDRMKDVHAGARRLTRVTGAFVRMAETFLGEYVEESNQTATGVVGKRKRSEKTTTGAAAAAEQEERGFLTMGLGNDEEPMDLEFLRPLQPQPQPQPQLPLRGNGVHQQDPAAAIAPNGVELGMMPPVHHQQHQQEPIDPLSQPGASSMENPPLTASSFLHNIPSYGQTVLAPDQGPLDFDWVLWDQSSLAHDLSPMDLLQVDVDDAQSLEWLTRASMMTGGGQGGG
ncbi:MAG: glyceraldehyde-3-phosphate dehydrogenase 1 [Watsoniomyces obsoletus]|nr:MAG: glyceraldehyde-3-phosphate dehydrogenase 1 [Watsoniomyces obsoletus]